MTKRPNILYIMSDDHAANAISAYGSRLAKDAPTPNIDRIAAEGIRLDNCHCTNSICTPSRASILTGTHSHINRVRTLADHLPDDCTLLSEHVRQGGYQTAIFGKWHLHTEPRGFDEWAVLPDQGKYVDPHFTFSDPDRIPAGAARLGDITRREEIPLHHRESYAFGHWAEVPGYVTDLVTDMTLDWLKERRDPDQPFFLCCQHKAPHDCFEFHSRHEDAFADVTFPEPPTLFEDETTNREISRKYGSTVSERWEPRNMVMLTSSENYPNGITDYTGLDFNQRASKAYQVYMQDYLRTVRAIDEGVGRVLDYLDASGLAENTLVIYTSDQGMMLGEHDKIDKRWIFDESQRMPLVVRYPEGIPAGSTNDDIVDNIDFAPTLLDFAGVEIPDEMQGRSFRSLLQGQTPADWRQSTYYRYWMHMTHHWVPAHYGIRTKTRKLIFFYGLPLDADVSGMDWGPTDPGFELYDLEKDPFETTNVFKDPAYADDVRELKSALLELKERNGDHDDAYPDLMAIRRELWPESVGE